MRFYTRRLKKYLKLPLSESFKMGTYSRGGQSRIFGMIGVTSDVNPWLRVI